MRYLKNEKKKSKLPRTLGILAACLIVAGIMGWFFLAPRAEKSGTADNETATVEIQTPYGKLRLEGNWVPALRYNVIQADVSELTFAAEIAGAEVKLFDVYLGSEDSFVGYLRADSGESVPVGVVVHDIVPASNWSEQEIEMAYEMQDALNDVLAQLGVDIELPEIPETPEEEGVQVSAETSFGTFTYLDYWNGGLRVVEENGCISGFGTIPGKSEQKLFVISVGEEGEIPVGVYTDKEGQQIPVFLTVAEPVFDGDWTEEEQRAIYGMQNVLNDILDQLNVVSPEQTEETTAEDVSVSTPYGTLVYPGEYNGKLRIDQVRKNGYQIRVFATMPEKMEIHLFDILIGGSGDIFAGILTDSYGSRKEVYLSVSELELEDGWTEQERSDVYAMQMLLNDFCEQIAVTRETEDNSDETTAVGDVVVRTPYGNLGYPGEYRRNLATETKRDNGYTVIFYAKRNTGEKVRLFDFIIGGTGDAYVGQITAGDGSVLDVYVTSYQLSGNDSWSDQEVQTMYEMQEAVNYVLEKLQESGTLVY